MHTIICSSKDIFELDIECHYLKSHYIKTYINTNNWVSKTDTITLNTIPLLIFTTAPLRYFITTALKARNWNSEKGEIHSCLQGCSEIFAKFICSCDCDIFLKNRNNFLGSGSRNTIYAISFQTLRRNLRDSFNLSDLHPVTLKNCGPSPRKHVSKTKENLLQFL